jgi:3-oxoadipate enol-lactonase
MDLLAKDLLDIATAVGWEEFSVCGVSVGAMTAARAAALVPERITNLIICSAAPHMHAPPGGWDARAGTARTDGMKALVAPMVERMFSAPFRETGNPHIETLRTVFLSTEPEGYASTVAVLRDADLADSLAAIKASTLVVTGTADPLVPEAASAAFKAGVVGAACLKIDAGHFPPVESPEQFAELLTKHLSSFAR